MNLGELSGGVSSTSLLSHICGRVSGGFFRDKLLLDTTLTRSYMFLSAFSTC